MIYGKEIKPLGRKGRGDKAGNKRKKKRGYFNSSDPNPEVPDFLNKLLGS